MTLLDRLRPRRGTLCDGDTYWEVGPFRHLVIAGPDGPFLERWALRCRLGGVFLHHVIAPDPGLDLHDHPWPFVSLVLSGGYEEEYADTRIAPTVARVAETLAAYQPDGPRIGRGFARYHRAGTIHAVPLAVAHRITSVRPGTWTLVVRGPQRRRWGFYLPDGWVDQYEYDYVSRRGATP